MPYKYFLKLGNLREIEVSTFSWSNLPTHSIGYSEPGHTPSPSATEIHVVISSEYGDVIAKLYEATVNGNRFAEATLTVREVAESQGWFRGRVVMSYQFTNITPTSILYGSAGKGIPMVQIGFDFESVSFRYFH